MKRALLSFAAAIVLSSCDVPGQRSAEALPIRPSEVADFATLFSQNCSGCHGKDGQGALTVGIGMPAYLAIADDATIRHVVEEGRPGTAMPAFVQKAGGLLTEAQVDILVRGIRSWAKPAPPDNNTPPVYATSQPGDAARGQNVFTAFCVSCHSPDGRGERAIADSSYLALVTDQHLRTVTIVGLPNVGMPDWRSYRKPLSDADVADVVAWLGAQRAPLSSQLKH
jgi:cytochrome c oxidase cbb3-type subunit 3